MRCPIYAVPKLNNLRDVFINAKKVNVTFYKPFS